MIVVVGSPRATLADSGAVAAGIAAAVAMAAAQAGAAVQIVGRVGEDGLGDGVLLELAAAGVGHVAVLRSPAGSTPLEPPAAVVDEDAPPTPFGDDETDDDPAAPADRIPDLAVDAADLELALRYVPDYRVLVLATELDERALDAVVTAASWSGAHLVALIADAAASKALPAATTVLLRPRSDPDGSFAAMVAAYAVALDRGDEPAAAFAAAQRSGGWAAVAD